MRWANSESRYGIISYLFHWVMAILIIIMLILGIYMTNIPFSPFKLKLFKWHKQIGMLILMLATLRIFWRLYDKLPLLHMLPRWEEISARLVHWVLYFFMFAVPITGWLVTSAAGLGVSFFNLFTIPTLIKSSKQLLAVFSETHEILAFSLLAVIILHVAAALKHYFIDKDTILQRMLWPRF